MHALSGWTIAGTRAVLCLWIVILAMATLVACSPLPEPEPAPIEPALAAVLGSNLNLGCQNGCPAAASVHMLNNNAALGSVATSPPSVIASVVLAGFLAYM